jgi:uncharacterized protein (DUF2237 family)
MQARNVLGGSLELCCTAPMTGFYRDGMCTTGGGDVGTHVICAQMTEEFLEFPWSKTWGPLVSVCFSLERGLRCWPSTSCRVVLNARSSLGVCFFS